MSRLSKTISVEKLDNSVLFTFAQNQHYLYDGTIEVPFNSLSIIADKSEAITLRKSASNDIFISAPWENFDIIASSKEDVVDALVEMLYDEAGISQEEVQDMIDAATSGIPSSQVIEQLRTDVNTISGNVQTLSGEVATKADASDLQALSEKVDTKLDASAYTPTDLSEYWTSAQTKSYVDTSTSGKADINVVNQAINEVSAAILAVSGEVDTKLDASAYTPTDLSEYWTSAETKSYVDGKVDDALDDYYDKDYVDAALADKLDASAYTPTDLSEYWTSAETQSAINAATSGIPSSQVIEQLRTDVNTVSGDVENKQDVLSAGTGIEISGNVISATGASITVDTELDETSNNPVANSAITNVIIDDEEVISRAINELNDRLVAVESGGSSVTVDTSLDSGSTNPVANSAITVALDGKANTSDLTIITNNVETISGAVDGKQDVLSAGTGIEISGNVISATGGGGATYSAGTGIEINGNIISAVIDNAVSTASTNPLQNKVITTTAMSRISVDNTYNNRSQIKRWDLADNSSGLFYIVKINGSPIVGTSGIGNLNLVQTSAITSAITSASTNAEVAGAKAVYDALDAKADASSVYTKTEVNNLVNNKFWCGTQAQYDALATKENDVLYLIHE